MPFLHTDMERSWSVYRHISPSKKVYVGITCMGTSKRWEAGKGYKNQRLFYRAILKYGWEAFIHQVMFSNLSEDRAKKLEISLISHYKKLNRSYNATDGGDGLVGFKFSRESKEKMRKSHLGRSLSEETKQKISSANKGRPMPKGFRKYLDSRESSPMLGKTHSPEALLKISEASKRNWKSRDKMNIIKLGEMSGKPVLQYSLSGEFIREFSSANKAGLSLEISHGNITSCCQGKRKSAGKYKWKYKNG